MSASGGGAGCCKLMSVRGWSCILKLMSVRGWGWVLPAHKCYLHHLDLFSPSSPFYGYHESEESFLKVYLCNPTLVRR